MHSDLIHLRIFPLEQLVLHEATEADRVSELQKRIEHSGVLRNPPIVAFLQGELFLVLDGATRVTAFHRMRIPTIVAQVVQYPSAQVHVQAWCHFLPEQSIENLQRFATELGFTPTEVPLPEAQQMIRKRAAIAYAVDHQGRALAFCCTLPLSSSLLMLRELIHRYSNPQPFQRVAWEEAEALLQHELQREGTYVGFPSFTPEEIRSLALSGARFPAGITRHIIAGRLLRADIPLAELQRPTSIAEKNRWLQQWWHERLHHHRLRYYPEPTFVCDD